MLISKTKFLTNGFSLVKRVNFIRQYSNSNKQETKIDINGQTINYLKTGNGPQALLCFPGALGTIWSDFKPQVESLDGNKFTIIAWDPPGYGSSRPPARQFSSDFYKKDADVAYNFLKKIGVDKFSLLGWSDGGISSMILSAKYPNAVEKLVIWGANSYILPEEVAAYETKFLTNGFNSVKFTQHSNNNKQLQEVKVDVNGQTINYLKVGDGPKTVFCFPGVLGTIWSDFKPQIESLDRTKFTIIAWDPPGYGFSRPPHRSFPVDYNEKDADAAYDFLKKIGVDKFSILGWSNGGMSSMILTAKYPNAVEKLIVVATKSYITAEEIVIYDKLRDLSKWSDKMKAPLIELYTEEGLQTMWNGWCDAGNAIFKNGGDICSSDLGKIKCPTLIVHGDKDPMIAAEHPDFLRTNIKKSKLYRFPEGKHNIHLRYPEEFNKIVTDFLVT